VGNPYVGETTRRREALRIAYQYKLEPTRTQSQVLRRLLETACRLYNNALQERKDAWDKERRTVTYHEQALKLRDWRTRDKELALLNFSACQHILRRLDKAFQRFFDGLKKDEKVGYPRFKKSHLGLGASPQGCWFCASIVPARSRRIYPTVVHTVSSVY
jgi:transposase